jgi:hypothetical protein
MKKTGREAAREFIKTGICSGIGNVYDSVYNAFSRAESRKAYPVIDEYKAYLKRAWEFRKDLNIRCDYEDKKFYKILEKFPKYRHLLW